MSQDNLSAVLYGTDDLRLEQRPIPQPKRGQLLIRIHVVGICGSDVHLLKNGHIGNYAPAGPIIIGHEASGTVVEIGEEVNGFSLGDKVVLEPAIPCRFCYDQCKQGRYNICSEIKCFIVHMDGTLTRFMACDADFCHKLPEGMSFEEGALIEPLAVGVHTVSRCGLKMGPIGVVCLLSAKAQGVGDIVVVDVSQERLEMIKKLGADYVFNSSGKSVEEIRDAVVGLLGKEPDATLECSGAQSCISAGILTTKRGGTLALVGLGADLSSVPMVEVVFRELDIKGVIRYANDFPVAIEQVAAGRIDVSKLTNAHYSLEEVHQAFERQQKGDVMKVFIHC